MRKKKTIAVSLYGVNPFVTPLVIKVTEVLTDKNDFTLEQDSSVKVYRTIEAREQINSLTAMGAKCFNFMVHRLKVNTDTVKMTPALFKEYAGVEGVKTFYNAISDLKKAGIIAKVEGVAGVYWINPAIVFFGRRHEVYPDNVKVMKTIDTTTKKPPVKVA